MTLPEPAALMSWPNLPSISIPLALAPSLKPLVTLPLVGQAQSMASSPPVTSGLLSVDLTSAGFESVGFAAL